MFGQNAEVLNLDNIEQDCIELLTMKSQLQMCQQSDCVRNDENQHSNEKKKTVETLTETNKLSQKYHTSCPARMF